MLLVIISIYQTIELALLALIIHGFLRFLFLTILVTLINLFKINYVLSDEQLADHEKAIKAVNEGEILPLDEILVKVNQKYAGRVISISLKDNEKGLFGWVYDIMIIEPGNLVKQIRVDAGTSTILSVVTGGK